MNVEPRSRKNDRDIQWKYPPETTPFGGFFRQDNNQDYNEVIPMEPKETEWRSAEAAMTDGPSLDFIRAVAELLETDADDILTELGYSHNEVEEVPAS